MAALMVSVDRTSRIPLYFQVAQQIEDAITSGTLGPGERLPNEVDLAERFGLSRPTLRQAIAYLVDRGLLVRKRGVGTQVVQTKVRRPLALSSLYDDLTRAGQQPDTTVLALGSHPAPEEVAHALDVEPDTPVLRIERLRRARTEPIALLTNYLPLGLVELTAPALEGHGLYELLRRAGIHLRVANQTVGARRASPCESELLDEPRGAALLTMSRTAYDDAGRAVEYGDHIYRGSRYSFELTLVER